MKKYKFTINGNQYEVNINSVEGNLAEVEVNGVQYNVEMESKPEPVKAQQTQATTPVSNMPAVGKSVASQSGGTIKSPLPGVILDVFVKEGDAIEPGQKLIMLEAMKMENNINADKAGVIQSIKVKKGDSVMEGDVLIVIA